MLKQLILCAAIFSNAFSSEQSYNLQKTALEFSIIVDEARRSVNNSELLARHPLEPLRSIFASTAPYFLENLVETSGKTEDLAKEEVALFDKNPTLLQLTTSLYRLTLLCHHEIRHTTSTLNLESYNDAQGDLFSLMISKDLFPLIALTDDGSIPPGFRNKYISKRVILLGIPYRDYYVQGDGPLSPTRHDFLLTQIRCMTFLIPILPTSAIMPYVTDLYSFWKEVYYMSREVESKNTDQTLIAHLFRFRCFLPERDILPIPEDLAAAGRSSLLLNKETLVAALERMKTKAIKSTDNFTRVVKDCPDIESALKEVLSLSERGDNRISSLRRIMDLAQNLGDNRTFIIFWSDGRFDREAAVDKIIEIIDDFKDRYAAMLPD